MAAPAAQRRWLLRVLRPVSKVAAGCTVPPPAPLVSRRRWASTATDTDVQVQEEPPWLLVRHAEPPSPAAELRPPSKPLTSLRVASAEEVVAEALRVTHQAAPQARWRKVAARLREVELDAVQAVLILHCMVRLDCFDKELLARVVDRIECQYFSMELGLKHHDALEMFEHAGNFQSLVNGLPLSHKLKIILLDAFDRDSGELDPEPPPPPVDPKKRWKTIDPVEMEAWEREQFEKGRLRVKRMRYVEAQVTKMRPGNKLRATLAVQLMQVLPRAGPGVLAQIAQACTSPKLRLLHGDLQDDFQEQLSRRVTGFDTHQVVPYVLAFTSGMQNFAGSEAYRAWRKKLLPAVLRLCRSADVMALLDSQRHFHPRLRGVPHAVGPAAALASPRDLAGQPRAAGQREEEEEDEEERAEESGEEDADESVVLEAAETPELALQRVRADRAAQLLIAVCTARQVRPDAELFDALASPLRTLLQEWLSGPGRARASSSSALLPLETLADLFAACVACGVDDRQLARQLADVFVAQFGEDLRSGAQAASSYHVLDLCNVAHGAALLCPRPEDVIDLVWAAMVPKLKVAEPHLLLMALNAVVRGASERVLTSPQLSAAVDEFLVQRLDFKAESLGKLGF